jgi:hypothetical protein
MSQDLGLKELAEGHVFSGADALIVTGRATGNPTDLEDLQAVKSAGVPTLVGSGVTPDNAAMLAEFADGLIVGSWLKREGNWRNPVEQTRVRTLKTRLPST